MDSQLPASVVGWVGAYCDVSVNVSLTCVKRFSIPVSEVLSFKKDVFYDECLACRYFCMYITYVSGASRDLKTAWILWNWSYRWL